MDKRQKDSELETDLLVFEALDKGDVDLARKIRQEEYRDWLKYLQEYKSLN